MIDVIVKIQFSEGNIMLFGTSYKRWQQQLWEYLCEHREIKSVEKIEYSKYKWIAYSGLKWCQFSNLDYHLKHTEREADVGKIKFMEAAKHIKKDVDGVFNLLYGD